MLLGGNLGLFCSVLVLVVGWLVSRWKWRRVVARREEIRRLMLFASEETARAELEAAYGYRSYGSPQVLAHDPVVEESVIGMGSPSVRLSRYQCEVCLSPTTTRCKQCKAVHYCSRECQTLHWRQGHKDECLSVITHQNIDVGVRSRLKKFKEEEIQSSQNEIPVMHNIKPVESSSEKRVISNSIPHVLGESNDTKIATEDNRKPPDMNVKLLVQLPDESSLFTVPTDVPVSADNNLNAANKYDGPSFSTVESSRQILSDNLLKSDFIETYEKCESSNSPGCNAADSEEHFSETSTPSDFWTGTVESKKININELELDDVEMSNSRSSSLPSLGGVVPMEMLGFNINKVRTDDPRRSNTLMMTRMSVALSEVSEDGSKSKGQLILNCILPDQNGVSCTSTKCSPKEETKLSSSNAYDECISEEGHVGSTEVDNVSSLLSKVAVHEVGGTNNLLNIPESQRKDSSRHKSFEAHSPSSVSAKKTAILDAQSVENKCTRGDASFSLGRDSYVRDATSGTNPSAMRVMDELKASSVIRHGSLGAGMGGMGRYEGLFPYETFVKLYNWNKVELRPCGLKNCGNSCYANAVLQCLAFTPPLTAYFLQGLHAKTCHLKEWCFTCEFEALVKKAKEGNYSLSPARLMSQMQHVASHLGNGREEDAHEFMRYAIDAMQLVCLKDAGVNVPSSLNEDTTLVGLTFGGYLQSKIKCMRCGGKSKQHERIMDLTIEIGGEIGSLEDALHRFTRSEILDGENKYRCGRCKSYEKAKKKLRVLEAPNVLTIALKRFQSGGFGKLNKSVKFPEILNLAPYMRGTSDKSPIYQLYGALVHLDVKNATFTGHYVCFIKNNQGKWFKADDSSTGLPNEVQMVELDKVLSNDAYVLFYARCSPRAPRLIRSSMDPRKSKNLTNKSKFYPTQPNRESTSTTDDIIFDHPWHSPLADMVRRSPDAISSFSINKSSRIGGDGLWARDKEFSCRKNNVNFKGVYVGR
ncbi:ubiquitin-specific protease [Orobanche gracilis]